MLDLTADVSDPGLDRLAGMPPSCKYYLPLTRSITENEDAKVGSSSRAVLLNQHRTEQLTSTWHVVRRRRRDLHKAQRKGHGPR